MTNAIIIVRPTDYGEQIGIFDKYYYWCPGCFLEDGFGLHGIPVKPHPRGWNFSGTLECPTFSPSQLTTGDMLKNGKKFETICHTFIESGMIKYLTDCTHPLAGQSVPMESLPDWFVKED